MKTDSKRFAAILGSLKKRSFPEANYWAIFNEETGRTMRFMHRSNEPIQPLKYPEFWDVKVTGVCDARCRYCYMDSVDGGTHYPRILSKFAEFFGEMDENQRPFQIAFGGGEPTLHPDFPSLLRMCRTMGMMPNFSTNGLHLNNTHLIDAINDSRGAIAISAHPQLKHTLEMALIMLERWCPNTPLSLHIVIEDENSIERVQQLWAMYHERIRYFVLLPMIGQGRAQRSCQPQVLRDLLSAINGKTIMVPQMAFGAKYYPYLQELPLTSNLRMSLSMYEPEAFSRFLDLKDMSVYPSSFAMEAR